MVRRYRGQPNRRVRQETETYLLDNPGPRADVSGVGRDGSALI
jgi:hypothetical protein